MLNRVGKPSLLLRRPENPLKPLVEVILTPLKPLMEVILTPLHYRPSFAQRYQTHQSMQNYQGYPLMTSNPVGKPSHLLRSPKNPQKHPVEVTLTPLYSRSSFAERFPTHLAMQNRQSYPLMTSDLAGKPSIVPKSPKTPLKSVVEVIVTPL